MIYGSGGWKEQNSMALVSWSDPLAVSQQCDREVERERDLCRRHYRVRQETKEIQGPDLFFS